MKYKFRAECMADVLALELPSIGTNRYGDLPGVECETETDLTLDELRDRMRDVQDGHVMVQTVALAEDYTGERNYDL